MAAVGSPYIARFKSILKTIKVRDQKIVAKVFYHVEKKRLKTAKLCRIVYTKDSVIEKNLDFSLVVNIYLNRNAHLSLEMTVQKLGIDLQSLLQQRLHPLGQHREPYRRALLNFSRLWRSS